MTVTDSRPEPILDDLDRFGGFIRRLSGDSASAENLLLPAGEPEPKPLRLLLERMVNASAAPILESLDAVGPRLSALPEGRRVRAEGRCLAARNALAWSLAAAGRLREAREALCRCRGFRMPGGGGLEEARLVSWIIARAVLGRDFIEAVRLYGLFPAPLGGEKAPAVPGGRGGASGRGHSLEIELLKAASAVNICVACASGAGELEPEPFLADISASLDAVWRRLREADPRARVPRLRYGADGPPAPGAIVAPADPLAPVPPELRDDSDATLARLRQAVRELADMEGKAAEAVFRRIAAGEGALRLREAFAGLAGPPPPGGDGAAATFEFWRQGGREAVQGIGGPDGGKDGWGRPAGDREYRPKSLGGSAGEAWPGSLGALILKALPQCRRDFGGGDGTSRAESGPAPGREAPPGRRDGLSGGPACGALRGAARDREGRRTRGGFAPRTAGYALRAVSLLAGNPALLDDADHYLRYLEGRGSAYAREFMAESLCRLIHASCDYGDLRVALYRWMRLASQPGGARTDVWKARATAYFAAALVLHCGPGPAMEVFRYLEALPGTPEIEGVRLRAAEAILWGFIRPSVTAEGARLFGLIASHEPAGYMERKIRCRAAASYASACASQGLA
ncbi:MAG: hypothetical protein LBG06_04030, partial [Deltaproteobacteria bacterium]|nr:hypothetical protein [Deltaproteobacteria bacterium]